MTSPTLPVIAGAAAMSLRLLPGEFCLIDVRDADLATGFADLCCGLTEPATGEARMLGRDWTALRHEQAGALRSRIGRTFYGGSWLGHLDAETNILLPQLHHTFRDHHALRIAAASMALEFGLPGLPLGRMNELTESDVTRAALVRAFLGDPELLLLENPVLGLYVELVPIVLNRIAAARDRGAAAVWMTRSAQIWFDRSFSATYRMRLDYRGLALVGTA